jgi:hypothetical protein
MLHTESNQRCGMRSKLVVGFVLQAVFFGVCGPVLAHHGSVAYADKVSEFKQATVTKFLWNNPHSFIEFNAKDDKGNVVNWSAETASPEALRLIGWSKTSLSPGDVVTIYIYSAKTGNPAGRLNRVILADGTVLHDTTLGGDAGNRTGYGPDSGPKAGNEAK